MFGLKRVFAPDRANAAAILRKAFLIPVHYVKYKLLLYNRCPWYAQFHTLLFGDHLEPCHEFYPQFLAWCPFLDVLNMVHHFCSCGYAWIPKPKNLTVENEGDESPQKSIQPGVDFHNGFSSKWKKIDDRSNFIFIRAWKSTKLSDLNNCQSQANWHIDLIFAVN